MTTPDPSTVPICVHDWAEVGFRGGRLACRRCDGWYRGDELLAPKEGPADWVYVLTKSGVQLSPPDPR